MLLKISQITLALWWSVQF